MRDIARSERGVTLVELMAATAVLSIAVVAMVAAFSGIQKAIQSSKNKTLASNLAQEKMQIIAQQSYFRVVPTMTPSFLADGTAYDTSAFPPETILEGGVSFQRYTDVQVVTENSGAINILPPTTPDTGMRQVTVTVAWLERGQTRKVSINGVLANPNTVESNSQFTGKVLDVATGNPIPDALVTVAENVGWRDTVDAGGNYSIRLSPGNFNLAASARGYFSSYAYLGIGPNNNVTQNFNLAAMSSGSVVGTAWVNPNVVISQVVVSTLQSNGYDVEYLELFNPTPNPVAVSGALNLNFVSGQNNESCLDVPLTYVAASIPAGGYYVIANTSTFMVDGGWITADAYYTDVANVSCSPSAPVWSPPTARQLAPRGHSGTWWLTDASGATVDAVGWSRGGSTHAPSHCEGACWPTTAGLQAGWQLVRASSPTFFSSSFGRAYDSGNNVVDFTTSATLAYPPITSAAPPQTVIAGAPAVGAVVTGSDGLSIATQAVSYGYPPVARFSMTQVATGTWTVLITSGSYELENDTVTVAASGASYVFPSSTTILETPATAGFIAGRVLDGFGHPISVPSAVTVSAAGQSATASAATGRYLLRVQGGSIDVAANSGFANPNYVAVSSLAVPVALGQITDGVDFTLTQGGRIAGWVTRDGVNGLQGVTVTATDVNGNVQDQQVSDVAGYFKTINLATGTYTVNIPLDTTETSNPVSASAFVSLGQTVFSATFTITGALGAISGSVTSSGKPISTGVLIIASTGTITTPPAISSQTLTAGAYYLTSSLENGTYSLSVRQSTYTLYGFYATISDSGAVTISTKTLANIAVVAGQTVTGKNLTW